jgi:hypothetical protein
MVMVLIIAILIVSGKPGCSMAGSLAAAWTIPPYELRHVRSGRARASCAAPGCA